jgi:hypothetical protein
LPYDYIVTAVRNLFKLRQRKLHEYERPIALLASQTAEINRNRKKRKKPYTIDEFYLYKEKGDQDLPSSRYGAAAKRLIEMGVFPVWALFIYKDLISQADDSLPPEDLALVAEDAIILAPTYEGFECHGMLIAMESASDQIRRFSTVHGDFIELRMPTLNAKVSAIEDAVIKLLK